MRGKGEFFAERVALLSQYVVYDAGSGASAVVWNENTLVGADPRPGPGAVPLVTTRAEGSLSPPPRGQTSGRSDWLLVIAREPVGDPHWAASLDGGRRQRSCGPAMLREISLSTPLTAAYAGGGVFDLDGNLLGVVGRCGASFAAIAAADVPRVLEAAARPEQRILRQYGMLVAELDDRAREAVGALSGALVLEVYNGSVADDAGLEPRDIVIGVGDLVVKGPADLTDLKPGTVLTVLRDGRTRKISVPAANPSAAPLGVQTAPRNAGGVVVEIAPGTPAYKAGLRTGDAILRVDGQRPASAPALLRLLNREQEEPRFVVYRRGNRRAGVFLTP
jgi:S1-C subfamily serine protease